MKDSIKEFIKSALVLSSLIIVAVFGVSWIMCGYLHVIGLTFELIALAFVITAVQRIVAAIPFKNPIVAVLVEYGIICAIVSGAGVLLKWFSLKNWYMPFLYVGIVYAAGFFLDMVVVKRDVDSINKMLERRRKDMPFTNDMAADGNIEKGDHTDE